MPEEKKSRLGRGLEALLGGEGSVATAEHSRSHVAPAEIEINPFQPRKSFDDDEIKSLGDSIRTHGILQPLVVRQVGEKFQLIAGERRLRAAQIIGLTKVPVTVVNFNDQQTLEAALIENVQRSDLNPIEKAQGFKDYLDRFHITHEQLADRLCLARSTITNLVQLLELPTEIQGMLMRGELTLGHAKVLKGIADPELLGTIAREIVRRGVPVKATDLFIKEYLAQTDVEEIPAESTPKRPPAEKTHHVIGIQDELRQKFGMKVEIKVKAKERGQIVLPFESNDDFEKLLDALRK